MEHVAWTVHGIPPRWQRWQRRRVEAGPIGADMAAPSCLVLCRMLRTVPHRDGGFCRKERSGWRGGWKRSTFASEPFLLLSPSLHPRDAEMANNLMLILAPFYTNSGLVMVTCNK